MKVKAAFMILAMLIWPQVCRAQGETHKSDSEVARMTPDQRVEEYCREYMRHGLWHRDYEALLDKYIMLDGLKAVPALVKVINGFDPADSSRRGMDKYSAANAAEILLGSLDTGLFRLRGFEEGREAIDAMRRVTHRMVAAHYDTAPDEGERSRRLRYEIAVGILKDLQGANDYDRAVQNTLKLRYHIALSDNELLDFANHLISQDPRYPSWSEPDWYVDQNNVNAAGSPLQYRIVENVEPFYKAYLKFHASKQTEVKRKVRRT